MLSWPGLRWLRSPAAHLAYGYGVGTVQTQQAAWHQVPAVLLTTVPASGYGYQATVRARWTGPDETRRTGMIPAPSMARAGRHAAGAGRCGYAGPGPGGHLAALQVAEQARQYQVGRPVFAHIGRPSLRAIDAGYRLPFREWASRAAPTDSRRAFGEPPRIGYRQARNQPVTFDCSADGRRPAQDGPARWPGYASGVGACGWVSGERGSVMSSSS